MSNDGMGNDRGSHPRKIPSERFPASEEQGAQISPGIHIKMTSDTITTELPGRAIDIPSSVSSLVMVGTIPVWLSREMTKQRFPESEEQSEQRSSGISNKITLHDISTKLPGRPINIPSLVSTLVMVGAIPIWRPRKMTNERYSAESKVQVQQLLPGIPDEVTLDHISTKLPWRALNLLWSVSSAWRQAIRCHRVYHARVRSQSVETLVVHSHCSRNGDYEVLCLYSLRDKCCYELPGIPGVDRGIPLSCQWISLDSKLYVLGGFLKDNFKSRAATDSQKRGITEAYKEVYVMDVAVQRQWKQCAPMQEGRYCFGCGILDGKIYAFGGVDYLRRVHGSEVYDSKTNAWSTIMPMNTWRVGHRVATHGEELFAHGGRYHCPENVLFRFFVPYSVLDVDYLEIYHPGNDEWRVVKPFGHSSGNMFMAEGKFYVMTRLGIYILDINDDAWEALHSNSFVGLLESVDISPWKPGAPVIVNDELFVKMSSMRETDTGAANWETCGIDCLMRSEGFRSEKSEIIWYAINCDNKFRNVGDFICPIQI